MVVGPVPQPRGRAPPGEGRGGEGSGGRGPAPGGNHRPRVPLTPRFSTSPCTPSTASRTLQTQTNGPLGGEGRGNKTTEIASHQDAD